MAPVPIGAIYFAKTKLISRQFTLGKKERLKSRKLIEQVFNEGRSFALFPYKVIYLFTNSTTPLQAGFTVSGKKFRRAVDRNRVKRLTREAYRLQKSFLLTRVKDTNHPLVLFFIYTSKELPDYTVIYKKMDIILQKLIQIADENHIAHT